MDPKTAREWLRTIIRVRRKLLKEEKSLRNKTLMTKVCEKLDSELKYFCPQGNKVFSFIRSRYKEIQMIIPGNDAEKHNIEKLESISQKALNLTI